MSDDLLHVLTDGKESLAGQDLRSVATQAAQAAGVSPDLFGALIDRGENGFANPSAVSKKGARGPGQLMPDTAAGLGVKNIDDPSENLYGAARYLRQLMDRYDGDQAKAVAAYNAGPEAVDKAGGVPDFPETQGYVQRVVGTANGPDLEAMLGQGDDTAAQSAYDKAFGAQSAPAGPASTKMVNGQLVASDTGFAFAQPQHDAYMTLVKAGQVDPTKEPGSAQYPWMQREATDTFAPGTYYIDTAGHLVQQPGLDDKAGLGTGIAQGVGDVATTLAKLAPGGQDSELKNRLVAGQMRFDAEHAGNPLTTVGRVGGQLLGSAPFIELGGTLAAPAFEAAGVPGQVVLGTYNGNKLLQGVSRSVAGAGQGGAFSALTSSANPDKPLTDQIGAGMIGGAVGSQVLPAIVSGGRGLVNAAIAGQKVSPELADLASLAVNKYRIPFRRSQILGAESRGMAIKDSERIGQGATGYAANNADQKTAWTAAVMREAGAPDGAVTAKPADMDAARKATGAIFERVAKNTTITDADAVLSGLGKVVSDAQMVLPEDEASPLLKQVEKIASVVQDGKISGETYQALARSGAPLDRLASSPGNVGFYAQKMRAVLDDALEASADPKDLADLQKARAQWKAMKTIEPLAEKAGPDGLIDPKLLAARMRANPYNGDLAYTGGGNMGELAQIGQTFMKEPPNSGTPARLAEMLKGSLPVLGAGAGGADLVLASQNPLLAAKLAALPIAAAGARYAAQKGVGAFNTSPANVNRLLEASNAAGARDLSTVDLNIRPLNDNVARLAGAGTNHLLVSGRRK